MRYEFTIGTCGCLPTPANIKASGELQTFLVLKKPDGPFLSFKSTPHILLLATYQQTLPDTTYSPTSYTTILDCHYSPAYYITTTGLGYEVPNLVIETGKAKAKRGSRMFLEI